MDFFFETADGEIEQWGFYQKRSKYSQEIFLYASLEILDDMMLPFNGEIKTIRQIFGAHYDQAEQMANDEIENERVETVLWDRHVASFSQPSL